MVERVIPDIKYGALPHRFEAGTPNSAGIVGFGAALTFLEEQNRIGLADHQATVLAYAKERLAAIAGCSLLCAALPQVAICSFSLRGHHPFDVGLQLDCAGIALRTGDHCASPLMKALGLNALMRISLACYNRLEDIDELISSLNNL